MLKKIKFGYTNHVGYYICLIKYINLTCYVVLNKLF